MRRAVPWAIAIVALVAFVASFSELQRMRQRFGEVSKHSFHDHAEVRQFMIGAALQEAIDPIVVLGDSIAEMAPLPRQICGRQVINAGVGGMTMLEAKGLVARLVSKYRVFLIALAIGSNERGSPTIHRDFSALAKAAQFASAKPLIVLSATADPQTNREIGEAAAANGVEFVDTKLPTDGIMSDGIHFTATAYRSWIPELETAISRRCG